MLPTRHLSKDPSALDTSTGIEVPGNGGKSGAAEACMPSAAFGSSLI